MASAVDQFGSLDILVNNAGMGDLAAIEDTSLEDWEHTIAIDQTGVFLGMKHCADALARPTTPRSSTSVRSSGPAAASVLRRRITRRRCRTHADQEHRSALGGQGDPGQFGAPGFIDTPILDQAKGTPIEQAMLDLTPMGRLGLPAEIAAVSPTSPVTMRPS